MGKIKKKGGESGGGGKKRMMGRMWVWTEDRCLKGWGKRRDGGKGKDGQSIVDRDESHKSGGRGG